MRNLTDAEKRAYDVCIGAPWPTAVELAAARDKLALIEVTVALWEAGAVEMYREDAEGPEDHGCYLFGKADATCAHAEVIRNILKGDE